LATKKNSKFGKLPSSIVLEVKNGAKYKIELISNLTVPEIQIDANPEGIVDFGKVLCGQRKIVTLRFLNLKEISCDWALYLRDPVGTDKEELKFELVPSSGKIASGSFQIVQAIFGPNQ
jgi:hydrocephalus-inducing protein